MSKGLWWISVPKSGTTFLSRYIEKFTGIPVVFGLETPGERRLYAKIEGCLNPEIGKVLTLSFSKSVMTRGFFQILGRSHAGISGEWTSAGDFRPWIFQFPGLPSGSEERTDHAPARIPEAGGSRWMTGIFISAACILTWEPSWIRSGIFWLQENPF
jgi:hypothetical protein